MGQFDELEPPPQPRAAASSNGEEGEEEEDGEDSESDIDFVTRFWQDGVMNLYLYYFYATLGNLLGDGSNAKSAPTRVCAVFFMLLATYFAAVFGEVILAMSNAKRGADAYAARMRSINEALEHQNIPRKFRRRVQRFYEFVWLSEHTQKITGEYLQELPQALKVDIVSSSFSHLLRRSALL